eukprot:4321157-Alexandrium_andersonii.AAC.1
MPKQAFAGAPGRGAGDAWYMLSAIAEGAAARGEHFASTTFDVYKAFDTLNRQAIYSVLGLMGMPTA